MQEKQLNALLKLLDDPDPVVYEMIEKKIIQSGNSIIPKLEKAWEDTLSDLLHSRLENIIQKIQFNGIFEELQNWKNNGANDLLKGAYLVAKYQYPDLEYEKLHEQVEKIKREVWLDMRNNYTPLEQIRVLNYVFYETYKFSGNNANFYAPQNSYINHVFETKKGNPISLAIIYSIIAQRLGFPVYGVNLPKNFIVAYLNQANPNKLISDHSKEILFYVNPYNRGAVLGKREIDYFLKQQKLQSDKSYYIPCENEIIIQRLLNNLIFSYQRLAYPEKIADLKKLMDILGNNLQEDTDWE